jgi:hypothetical protein
MRQRICIEVLITSWRCTPEEVEFAELLFETVRTIVRLMDLVIWRIGYIFMI